MVRCLRQAGLSFEAQAPDMGAELIAQLGSFSYKPEKGDIIYWPRMNHFAVYVAAAQSLFPMMGTVDGGSGGDMVRWQARSMVGARSWRAYSIGVLIERSYWTGAETGEVR